MELRSEIYALPSDKSFQNEKSDDHSDQRVDGNIWSSDLRSMLYRLINHFKTRKVTTILTNESTEIYGAPSLHSSAHLSFLVDTVVTLRHAELNGELRKTIAIMKMRGSDHDTDIKEYHITKKGFELKASLKGYEGLLTGTPHLASKLSSTLESL